MANEPKIAIIGAGPIGGILGAYLAQAGHCIVLCDILESHLDAIVRRGLTITGVAEMTAECEQVAHGVSELCDFSEVDTIVICTKASVMARIIPEIEKVAQPGTHFICNQNGLDNEDALAETFGPDNVLRIIPNYAGGVTGDGEIRMSFFNPPNYIGAMTSAGAPAARQMAEIMTEAGLETKFTTDIKRYEWEKAILNAALNSTCALTGKTMKDMMDFELTEVLVEKLMREGIKVAEAVGVTLDETFMERGIQYLKRGGYHKTSMTQDIERGTPTEIDWLNAKIVEHGRACGLEIPYNFTIMALVKALEMKSKAPQEH
jgi:2-dehydropantoate 2-reductase